MTDSHDRPGEDYIIAIDAADGEVGCLLYQHLCGHVAPLSRMEAIGVPAAGDLQQAAGPTGAPCPRCGESPEPPAWRVLWRKRSPADDAWQAQFRDSPA